MKISQLQACLLPTHPLVECGLHLFPEECVIVGVDERVEVGVGEPEHAKEIPKQADIGFPQVEHFVRHNLIEYHYGQGGEQVERDNFTRCPSGLTQNSLIPRYCPPYYQLDSMDTSCLRTSNDGDFYIQEECQSKADKVQGQDSDTVYGQSHVAKAEASPRVLVVLVIDRIHQDQD